VGEAARLTRKYKRTGFRIEQLHVRLVFLPLIGQQLGPGSISNRVRVFTFFETTRHVDPFIFGAGAQGYVVRVLLVDLVQVLFVVAPTVMYVVGDWDDETMSGIRMCSQFTVKQ